MEADTIFLKNITLNGKIDFLTRDGNWRADGVTPLIGGLNFDPGTVYYGSPGTDIFNSTPPGGVQNSSTLNSNLIPSAQSNVTLSKRN